MTNTRHTEADYQAEAARIGLKWMGPVLPERRTDHTVWMCQETGALFWATFAYIRTFRACPVCSAPWFRTRTSAHYMALAAEHGFYWINTPAPWPPKPPRATGKPTGWRCRECGHEFMRAYSDIQQGRPCPRCGTVKPIKISADYSAVAQERGIEWIDGDLPQTAHHPAIWRCPEGHEFERSYESLTAHPWAGCPHCNHYVNGTATSRPQRDLATQLGGILNHPLGRRRIDVALPDDLIAVEYDCTYWHQDETGQEAADRDRVLLAAGWKVLHLRADGINLPGAALLAAALGILKNTPAQALTLLCDLSEQEM